MKFRDCRTHIKSDLERMAIPSFKNCIKYLIFNASFKITFWYRFGFYLESKKSILFKIIYFFIFLIHKHNQFKTGIQISFNTNVGKGLLFPHFSCIVIRSGVVLGNNVTIFHGTTIGSNRYSLDDSPAIIGDNVVIFSGAQIIGSLRIGDNAIIAANAVVTKDVPDNAVVAGVPARIINMNGKDYSKLY